MPQPHNKYGLCGYVGQPGITTDRSEVLPFSVCACDPADGWIQTGVYATVQEAFIAELEYSRKYGVPTATCDTNWYLDNDDPIIKGPAMKLYQVILSRYKETPTELHEVEVFKTTPKMYVAPRSKATSYMTNIPKTHPTIRPSAEAAIAAARATVEAEWQKAQEKLQDASRHLYELDRLYEKVRGD